MVRRLRPWRIYRKESDFVDPGPSNTFVFLDEREDSINDGMFVVDMGGFPGDGTAYRIVDIPASYHNGSGGFSFADGHSETKKPGCPHRGGFQKGTVTPYNRPLIIQTSGGCRNAQRATCKQCTRGPKVTSAISDHIPPLWWSAEAAGVDVFGGAKVVKESCPWHGPERATIGCEALLQDRGHARS